jgi:hypothetical protein
LQWTRTSVSRSRSTTPRSYTVANSRFGELLVLRSQTGCTEERERTTCGGFQVVLFTLRRWDDKGRGICLLFLRGILVC